jgi:hypothetical protein
MASIGKKRSTREGGEEVEISKHKRAFSLLLFF